MRRDGDAHTPFAFVSQRSALPPGAFGCGDLAHAVTPTKGHAWGPARLVTPVFTHKPVLVQEALPELVSNLPTSATSAV